MGRKDVTTATKLITMEDVYVYPPEQQKIHVKSTGMTGMDDGVVETLELCSFDMRSVLNKNKRFEFIMFVPQIIMVLSKVGNNDGLYVQKGRVCHFIIIIIQQKIRFCSTTYSAKQVSCCDFTMESFSYEVLLFSRGLSWDLEWLLTTRACTTSNLLVWH